VSAAKQWLSGKVALWQTAERADNLGQKGTKIENAGY
jgi:hypothetical protein